MARDKTSVEASLEVAARIEEAGVNPKDIALVGPGATLVCTAGAVSEIKDRPTGSTFRVVVSHSIEFSKEYEVSVDDEDKVTYKEIG